MVDSEDGSINQGQKSDTIQNQGEKVLSGEKESRSEADSSAVIIINITAENSLNINNSHSEVKIQACNGSNEEMVKIIPGSGAITATNSSYIEPILKVNLDGVSKSSIDSEDIVNDEVSDSSITPEEPESTLSDGPKCWVCKQDVNIADQKEVFCDCKPKQGYLHKKCLIDWMNKFCKGRCPVCAFKFKFVAHQKPMSEWGVDPVLKQFRKRYIIMATLNIIVIIVVSFLLVELLHQVEEKKRQKTIIASVICVIFVLYIFHHTRMYWRVYERMKIYNNKVVDVFERSSLDQGIVRCNMSSVMNQSEIVNNYD